MRYIKILGTGRNAIGCKLWGDKINKAAKKETNKKTRVILKKITIESLNN